MLEFRTDVFDVTLFVCQIVLQKLCWTD